MILNIYYETELKKNTLIIKNIKFEKNLDMPGWLDISELPFILDETNPEDIIFDFDGIDKLDSYMIGVLYEFFKIVKEKPVYIKNIYPHMEEKLRIVGLDEMYTLIE